MTIKSQAIVKKILRNIDDKESLDKLFKSYEKETKNLTQSEQKRWFIRDLINLTNANKDIFEVLRKTDDLKIAKSILKNDNNQLKIKKDAIEKSLRIIDDFEGSRKLTLRR